MMNKKRITTSLLLTFLVEVINKLAPFFVLYLAKTRLGTERFGYSQFAINLMETAIPFVVFSYVIVGSKEVNRLRDDPVKLGSMLSSMIMLRSLHAFMTIAALAFICGYFPQYQPYFKLVLILSFVLVANAFEMTHVLIATQRFHFVNLSLGLTKIFSLYLIYRAVHSPEDADLYAILSLGTNAIVCFISMVIALRYVRLYPPQWVFILDLFRKGSYLAVIYIGLNLLDRYDVFLVERFSGTVGAALYIGPARISQSLHGIIASGSLIFLSELIGLNSRDKITAHVGVSVLFGSIFLIPVCVGIWFVDKAVITFIFGDDYASTARLLSLLVLAAGAQGFLTIFGFQVLALKDEIRKFGTFIFMGLFVGIVSACVLVPYCGLYGVAMAALGAKLLSAILVTREAQKFLGEFHWRWIMKPIFAAICMGLVLFFLNPNLKPIFIILIAAGVYGAVLSLSTRREILSLVRKYL